MFLCEKACEYADQCVGCNWRFADKLEDIDEEFRNCSSLIEVMPVRRARWVKIEGMAPPEQHGKHVCSLCGGFALLNLRHKEELTDVCPHCMAIMRKK